MITLLCIACLGTGRGFTLDSPCEHCDGSGEYEEPGTALVYRPTERGDLITNAYVYERMHMAQCYRDGWEAARDSDLYANYAFPRTPPRYVDLRGYLITEFDTDLIVAAMVALFLTRDEGETGDAHHWLTFHPSFYEAEQ